MDNDEKINYYKANEHLGW